MPNEIDLRQLIDILIRRWKFVIAMPILAAIAAGTPLTASVAQGRPSTDIWLVTLQGPGVPKVGRAENLTQRLGYDNQPSFTPDGRAILYTRIEGDGPSDIFRLDLATRESVNLTRTPVESVTTNPSQLFERGWNALLRL